MTALLSAQCFFDRPRNIDVGQMGAIFAGAVNVFDDFHVARRLGGGMFDQFRIKFLSG